MRALWDALPAALDGSGPAIAPTPTTSMTVPDSAVARMLDATRPDDPSSPLEHDDAAVVLSTSGSTQHPRGVLLSAQALSALSEPINAGARPQWVAAIPVTSAGGMNVLMRAWAAQREPVALASIGGAAPFTPEVFVEAISRALTVTDDVRVSLVSAQVRRLLGDDAGTDALRACAQVLVGGGPLDPLAREAARGAGIVLTSTYGATETAGGCVFDGVALPGVRVRIDGAAGQPGEVVVGGPTIALGYRSDPAASAARFVDGEFRTGDLGVVENGVLRITGRMDDVVIVNGVSVSVIAVEQVAKSVPDVEDAVAVAVPTSTEPRIVVFAIEREDASFGSAHVGSTHDAVRAMVREQLGNAAVPREVRVLSAFPHLPGGKVDRLALRTLAES